MDSMGNTTIVINIPSDLKNLPAESVDYVANHFGTIIIWCLTYGLFGLMIFFCIGWFIQAIFGYFQNR